MVPTAGANHCGSMTTLHIEHPITDFTAWQAAFDRFESARVQAGVRAYVIRQPIDDPHYVLIDLEFEAAEDAEAFDTFLRTRIWADPQNSPALKGTPITRILETRARA